MRLPKIGFVGFVCFPFYAEAADFPAEKMALQLCLPALAENTLQPHVFDAFPKGAECHELLAQVSLLKKDFPSLKRHLQRCPRDAAHAYLSVCYDGYLHHRWYTTQLFFARQNQPLGRFLYDAHEILLEPMGSIRWACFWAKQQRLWSKQEIPLLQQLALEIQYTIYPQNFLQNVPLALWQKKAFSLQERGDWKALKTFLKRTMPQLRTREEQVACLLWMFRTERFLQNRTDDLLRAYGSWIEKNPEYAEMIFTEWIHSFPEPLQQWEHLQQFYALFCQKNKKLFAQMILLLQVKVGMDLGKWEEANALLEKELPALELPLQVTGYEMMAKMALFSTPARYLFAADCYAEARRFSNDPAKQIEYDQLRCRCYLLMNDYERAYWEYEKGIQQAMGHPSVAQWAAEWCECGILCHASAEELEQQLAFCRASYGLSPGMESKIRWEFAQYQWEQQHWRTAWEALQLYTFSTPLEQARAQLLQGKCLFQMGNPTKALQLFTQLPFENLSGPQQADYFLWKGTVGHVLQQHAEAQISLQHFWDLKENISMDLQAQAALLQAELQIQQQEFVAAKQTLLQFAKKVPKKWIPFLLFQAGLYAEKYLSAQEAIAIYQQLYETDPLHSLAKDARLKQGILLLNTKHYEEAQEIFASVLPKLQEVQALWCRFLIQKCQYLSGKQSFALSQVQLEVLLQETLPRALRLEIVWQLASIYQEQGNRAALQACLWKECYPLFAEEPQSFSPNDLYWLNRCLWLLAQQSEPAIARRLRALMLEAQLPGTFLPSENEPNP